MDTLLPERTAALVAQAGYGTDDPLVVGVQPSGASPSFLTGGRTAAGTPLGADTVVYTASLAKQVTAACAALLVQQGQLDLDSSMTN